MTGAPQQPQVPQGARTTLPGSGDGSEGGEEGGALDAGNTLAARSGLGGQVQLFFAIKKLSHSKPETGPSLFNLF